MAEEEKTEPQENEGKEKKSSNLVLIIVIVVLVLTLIIGAVLVVVLSSGDDENVDGGNKTEQVEGDKSSKKKRRSNASKGLAGVEVGPMYPLDGFTINLLSDSGRRYLKTTITLELSGEEMTEELDSKKPVIRDVVIGILASNTLEAIATAKGKEKLKETIVNQLNLRIKDGEVKNIYFDEFVIQ